MTEERVTWNPKRLFSKSLRADRISYVTPGAASLLKGIDIEHFFVAHSWDGAGRIGIERMAFKSGGWGYCLDGLAEGQDPCEMLRSMVNAKSGFSQKQKAGA